MDGKIIATVEISKGSRNKYEINHKTKELVLDRVLNNSVKYPENYGFINNTLAKDGDPLDVLILSHEPLIPTAQVMIEPIGLLEMIDNGKEDHKIIAVIKGDSYTEIFLDSESFCHSSLISLRVTLTDFFKTYKNNKVKVGKMLNKTAALQLIKESKII